MKLIVAVDENWSIGKNGDLLFHLPADMKFFKEMTMGKTVVMGRHTLESFPGGKPLPGRRNIVLTRNPGWRVGGVDIVYSIDEASELVPNEDVFVIGGAEVYQQMLPLCSTAYITKVHAKGDGDCFFPNLDEDEMWHIVSRSEVIEDNGYQIEFLVYEK